MTDHFFRSMRFCLSEQETTNLLEAIDNTASDSVRVTVHSRGTEGVPMELANTPVIYTTAFGGNSTDLVFETSESSVAFRMNAHGLLGHIEFDSI